MSESNTARSSLRYRECFIAMIYIRIGVINVDTQNYVETGFPRGVEFNRQQHTNFEVNSNSTG